jgi:phospholipase C
MHVPRRVYAAATAVAVVTLGVVGATSVAASVGSRAEPQGGQHSSTVTPIKHLVVIFDENISFDHYFGTYPYAQNLPGENPFHAKRGTPTVNGLYNQLTPQGAPTGPLLTNNPNGPNANPVRLGPDVPLTCDQDHDYSAEQQAADHGAEDMYPKFTGSDLTVSQCLEGFTYKGQPEVAPPGTENDAAVMSYYDGNTVTALWNYAQHYAMNDNAYGTTYGPSTPGALNVTAAQTYGTTCGPTSAAINVSTCPAPAGLDTSNPVDSNITAGPPVAAGPGTTYSDADPTYDICSYVPSSDGGDGGTPAGTITMGGNNIGEELTSAKVTWGWFQGGFDDGYVPGKGTTPPTTAQICSQTHKNVGGTSQVDYSPHHEPFEYYASTANPMHLPPTSVAMVGHTDQANHQYDTADFFAAADQGNLPAVSYLKAPKYQDGHAGYSDPLDEQTWLVTTINRLESLPTWKSTAIVITWDDSDGWYDHVLAPVITESQTALDFLTGTGECGSMLSQVPVNSAGQPEQGKCGPGPRLPFLVISPFAKSNFVADNLIDQSSVVKFIEYNWRLPALGNGAADMAAGSILPMFDFRSSNPPLFLNPSTGEPVRGQ